MMLTIRGEQMRAFSECMLRQFEDRMVVHLRQRFPDQTAPLDERELRTLIRGGVARAKGHGIVLETDVRRFLEYLVLHGPHFGTEPQTAWAGEILRTEGLKGTEKMDRIDNRATFALRETRR